MEFNKIKSLLNNATISIFDDDAQLYAKFKIIADQIVFDESGSTDLTLTWLIEPYAYIISKLALNKLQNTSEERLKLVESDYKRALEILRAKKEKATVLVKCTRGTVGGNVW